MYDNELAREILGQIRHATKLVLERFEPIEGVSDFTDDPVGLEKLDSICMQLIVIGEALKNFDKVTDHSVLQKCPQVDWKKAKGLRDIITHHYIDINAEAIHDACRNKMPELAETIAKMLQDID